MSLKDIWATPTEASSFCQGLPVPIRSGGFSPSERHAPMVESMRQLPLNACQAFPEVAFCPVERAAQRSKSQWAGLQDSRSSVIT
jgi:hypothetical protein